MRATPAKKRDQQSRWSAGSSSGGSFQHKSSGSWRRGETGRRPQQSEEGARGKALEDIDLQDDGSSPLKLIFGDNTSTDKESRVVLEG
jgi:hypothetical protein